MKRYRALLAALLLDVVGAGGALLISIQTWQRLGSARPRPFPYASAQMIGRDVDSAITALALVALAGVVAVLATKGWWRRAVGAVVALAGIGVVVRAALSTGAVADARARSFLSAHQQTAASLPATPIRVEVLTAWPVLTVVCGVLVAASGALVAVRGGRWQAMSARYERDRPPDDPAAREGKAAAAMWSALDRGDDPTES